MLLCASADGTCIFWKVISLVCFAKHVGFILTSLFFFLGSDGFRGRGRPPGSPDLLVYSKVCERKPSPSLPGAHHPLRAIQTGWKDSCCWLGGKDIWAPGVGGFEGNWPSVREILCVRERVNVWRWQDRNYQQLNRQRSGRIYDVWSMRFPWEGGQLCALWTSGPVFTALMTLWLWDPHAKTGFHAYHPWKTKTKQQFLLLHMPF